MPFLSVLTGSEELQLQHLIQSWCQCNWPKETLLRQIGIWFIAEWAFSKRYYSLRASNAGAYIWPSNYECPRFGQGFGSPRTAQHNPFSRDLCVVHWEGVWVFVVFILLEASDIQVCNQALDWSQFISLCPLFNQVCHCLRCSSEPWPAIEFLHLVMRVVSGPGRAYVQDKLCAQLLASPPPPSLCASIQLAPWLISRLQSSGFSLLHWCVLLPRARPWVFELSCLHSRRAACSRCLSYSFHSLSPTGLRSVSTYWRHLNWQSPAFAQQLELVLS